VSGWTRERYALFRMVLGVYLVVHFAGLVPFAGELFSRDGVVPSIALNPLGWLFPNVLGVADTPAVAVAVLLAAVGLATCFTLGVADRLVAVALWYVWACLLGRNPLISNPSIPYVGWLLLAHALVAPPPMGPYEDGRARAHDASWRLPRAVHEAAWAVLSLGYTYSAATKLCSPSWLDGSAIAHVVAGPLARPGVLRDVWIALPTWLLAAVSYGSLALELLFAPLSLARCLRPWLWVALLGMHVGLIALIDFADLSLGMIMFHAFTFDPTWLESSIDRLRVKWRETPARRAEVLVVS
jgi:hypothetical protein